MRYLPLACLLFLGMTPNNNPLSQNADLNTSVQQVFDEAQDKNFRVDFASPTLRNLNEHQVLFTSTGTVRFWTRINNVLYYSGEFNNPYRDAWGTFYSTSSTTESAVNISSFVRVGVGLVDITFFPAWSSPSSYTCVGNAGVSAAIQFNITSPDSPDTNTKTASRIRFRSGGVNNVEVDTILYVHCFGR